MSYADRLQRLLLGGRPAKDTRHQVYTFIVDGSVVDLVIEADKEIKRLVTYAEDRDVEIAKVNRASRAKSKRIAELEMEIEADGMMEGLSKLHNND